MNQVKGCLSILFGLVIAVILLIAGTPVLAGIVFALWLLVGIVRIVMDR